MELDRLSFVLQGAWAQVLPTAAAALALGLFVHRLGTVVVLRLVRHRPLAAAVAREIRSPARLALPLLALQVVWDGAPDALEGIAGVRHLNAVLLLAACTWLLVRALRGLGEGVIARHPADVADNLAARRIHTQTRVLTRSAMVVVILAGLAMMLMTFPGARQVGASLLASAGVAGLVAGIAARPVFSNLIAGLQIALAQPIRIDDVLVVEGEWGRVEEITGTYVVLRIWDERRLIIPLQWFIEHPFQNWTRRTAQIIGTVFLWVDYRMPLEPLRTAALQVCKESPEWDGRLCLLQVTEAGEQAMQLRLLLSSADSGRNWDLRCRVREALVDLLQRDYPDRLPRWRASLSQGTRLAAVENTPPGAQRRKDTA